VYRNYFLWLLVWTDFPWLIISVLFANTVHTKKKKGPKKGQIYKYECCLKGKR